MTEQINNTGQQQNEQNSGDVRAAIDPGIQYLSRALRSAFFVLKIIMVFLVVVYLASGIRIVGSDEQALVLMFGEIRGVGEQRILGPGLKLLFPYPIHEIVRIPVEKKINLRINSFWYYQTLEETLPEGPKKSRRITAALDPVRDGYCIVRGQRHS